MASKRAVAVTALTTTAVAAAVFLGVGGAEATYCFTPTGGNVGDVYLAAPPVGVVTTDVNGRELYACSSAAGATTSANVHDDVPSSPGAYVSGGVCAPGYCVPFNRNGVEAGTVAPRQESTPTSDNVVLGGDGNTCVQTTLGLFGPCSTGAANLAAVSLSKADRPRTRTEAECVYLNGVCVVSVPRGAGVAAGSQTSDGVDTVRVTTPAGSTSREVGYTCVEYGTSWDYSTGCR